jgi:hypothetical protein
MLTCKGFAFIVVSMTCQPAGAAPDTYCQIAKPVYWSRHDTALTKRQADRENRKYKRLCQK